jgi:predicted AlkP superfamily pyrophosphatase or phosphodiesterase
MRKRRIGTAKFFTLLLLLYHTSAKDAGIYSDTTFIVLGDHGFQDTDYKICMNTAFRDAGLINVNKNGKLTDWQAYVNSCDGSAQVYLKDNNNSETVKKVEQILDQYKNKTDSCIKEIYTKEQCKEKGVTGDFSYMLEANRGYYFANDWTQKDVINSRDYYAATHGYDPSTPNYRTFFLASGAGIRKGVVISSINIVDECPTMAKLLGLKMANVDGRILDEIIKK